MKSTTEVFAQKRFSKDVFYSEIKFVIDAIEISYYESPESRNRAEPALVCNFKSDSRFALVRF